jgi:dolichyl-phosphate-mannose-protein mannosyltransferase
MLKKVKLSSAQMTSCKLFAPFYVSISTSNSAGIDGGRSWRGGLGRITSGEWKVLLVVLLVACSVRLFRLRQPDSAVFDEVHFEKFSGKDIRTRYYVDVHPPLATLLITLAAWIDGYNGMSFTPHNTWDSHKLIPLSNRRLRLWRNRIPIPRQPRLRYDVFRTSHSRHRSRPYRLPNITRTRLFRIDLSRLSPRLIRKWIDHHILLDSQLLFFTGPSILFWCMLCIEDKHPITKAHHGHVHSGGRPEWPVQAALVDLSCSYRHESGRRI